MSYRPTFSRRHHLLLICLAAYRLVTPCQAKAQPITLMSGSLGATIDPASQLGLKSVGANGSGSIYGGQQWYWYRIGNSNGQSSLNTISAPAVSFLSAYNCFIQYSNSSVAVELYCDFYASPNGVCDVSQVLTISNVTSTAFDFHLFKFSHLSSPQPSLETVLISQNVFSSSVGQSSAPYMVLESVQGSSVTSHAEANVFPQTLLALNSGSPLTLNDTLQAGPGDVTWALQWDFTIQPGSSVFLSCDTAFYPLYPPPVIAPIADRTVNVNELIQFTNTATGLFPPFHFSLGIGFQNVGPAGATLDRTTGVFTWRPSPDQAGTTNLLKIVCDDGNMPVGWSTQQFTVIVRDSIVSQGPLLSAALSGSQITLSLFGEPGSHYAIDSSSGVAPPFSWLEQTQVNLLNPSTNLTFPANAPSAFYRARKL
jgi:hypothetical protein